MSKMSSTAEEYRLLLPASFLSPEVLVAIAVVVVVSVGLLLVAANTTKAKKKKKTAAAFGEWESPIKASTLTAKGSVKLLSHDLQCDEEGRSLFWIEERPQEAGRSVIVSHKLRSCLEGKQEDETPPGYNARTMVHEYGGGCFRCFDGSLVFSNFKEGGHLYMTLPEHEAGGKEMMKLTAEGLPHRFADGDIDTSRARRSHLGSWVNARYVCVREDHTKPKPADVVNEVVAVNLSKAAGLGGGVDESTAVLATGRDFYASPKVSPDGKWLAYVCWDHPSMPWDRTELWLVALDDTTGLPIGGGGGGGGGGGKEGANGNAWCIVGGDGVTSVQQPMWAPDGSGLYFASDHADPTLPRKNSRGEEQQRYYNVYCLPTAAFEECGIRHNGGDSPSKAAAKVGQGEAAMLRLKAATTPPASPRGGGGSAGASDSDVLRSFPSAFSAILPVDAECARAPWQMGVKTFDVGPGGWCLLAFAEVASKKSSSSSSSSSSSTSVVVVVLASSGQWLPRGVRGGPLRRNLRLRGPAAGAGARRPPAQRPHARAACLRPRHRPPPQRQGEKDEDDQDDEDVDE